MSTTDQNKHRNTISTFCDGFDDQKTEETIEHEHKKCSLFTIDFDQPNLYKKDFGQVNKLKTDRKGNHWDFLTERSKTELNQAITAQDTSARQFSHRVKKVNVMFTNPDICCEYDSHHSMNLGVNQFDTVDFGGVNSIIYTDLFNVKALRHDIGKSYGWFYPVEAGSLGSGICAIHRIQAAPDVVAFSEFNSGEVKLIDQVIGKEIRKFSGRCSRGSILKCTSEGSTLITSDNEFNLRVHDIRTQEHILDISNFSGSSALPVSLELLGRTILLGTSEGPVLYDITSSDTTPAIINDEGICNKAVFLGSSSFMNAEISSHSANIVTLASDGSYSQQTLEMPQGLSIVDVAGKSGSALILAEKENCHNSQIFIIQRNNQGIWKVWDSAQVEGRTLRAGFNSRGDACVIGEKEFNIFSLNNRYFVEGLIKKVGRRIRANYNL